MCQFLSLEKNRGLRENFKHKIRTIVINRSGGNFSAHSNQPKNSEQNPDFVKSLKAQGYEESQSQSKLVYDFKKKTDSPTTQQRDSSPYKPNPLQFIRPVQNQYSPKSAKKIVPAKSNLVSK